MKFPSLAFVADVWDKTLTREGRGERARRCTLFWGYVSADEQRGNEIPELGIRCGRLLAFAAPV